VTVECSEGVGRGGGDLYNHAKRRRACDAPDQAAKPEETARNDFTICVLHCRKSIKPPPFGLRDLHRDCEGNCLDLNVVAELAESLRRQQIGGEEKKTKAGLQTGEFVFSYGRRASFIAERKSFEMDCPCSWPDEYCQLHTRSPRMPKNVMLLRDPLWEILQETGCLDLCV
jgi:hypothetical protein